MQEGCPEKFCKINLKKFVLDFILDKDENINKPPRRYFSVNVAKLFITSY